MKSVVRIMAGSVLCVALATFSLPAAAQSETDPTALAMAGDLVVARPLGVAIAALGTVAFIVSLPFTAAGGNVDQAAETLVKGPARATFVRCLGCTATASQRR